MRSKNSILIFTDEKKRKDQILKKNNPKLNTTGNQPYLQSVCFPVTIMSWDAKSVNKQLFNNKQQVRLINV